MPTSREGRTASRTRPEGSDARAPEAAGGAADAGVAAGRGARRTRATVTALAIGALLVATNLLVTLALAPYGSVSSVTWSEYRKTRDIDTLLIGSSYAHIDVDPAALDGRLGSHSFNFGTPAQSLDHSLVTLETVLAERRLRRVVLCLAYESCVAPTRIESAVSFAQAKCDGEPLPQQLADTSRILMLNHDAFGGAASLAWMFPWSYLHVPLTASAIADNVSARLAGNPVEALRAYNPGWTYFGQGYGSFYGTLDFASVGADVTSARYAYAGLDFKPDKLADIEAICQLCREHGTALYVVAVPHPAFNVMCLGNDYPANMGMLQSVVEAGGGSFVDFSLARPSFYQVEDEEYLDSEHLNPGGAARFSRTLAALIADIEDGRDVGGRFFSYDQWDDYLASVRYVSLVSLTTEVRDGGIELAAHAYAGTGYPVEYRFELLADDGTTWQTLRDYDASGRLWLPTQGHGTATVRVLARGAGATGGAERTYQREVLY